MTIVFPKFDYRHNFSLVLLDMSIHVEPRVIERVGKRRLDNRP